jgi:hypothetical protein
LMDAEMGEYTTSGCDELTEHRVGALSHAQAPARSCADEPPAASEKRGMKVVRSTEECAGAVAPT